MMALKKVAKTRIALTDVEAACRWTGEIKRGRIRPAPVTQTCWNPAAAASRAIKKHARLRGPCEVPFCADAAAGRIQIHVAGPRPSTTS